jgi:hypothetical protein
MMYGAHRGILQGQALVPGGPSTIETSELQAKAQSGDSNAQVILGKAYQDGRGVPQSDSLAMKWYRAAADQGNATAENSVGLLFRLGQGVEQDKVEAVRWYRKAAKQENANAMFNMGAAYYNGDGVSPNIVSSYVWFLLAEKAGSQPAVAATNRMKKEAGEIESDALEQIGDMYEKGDDLPLKPLEALNWYRRAAENGEGQIQIKLANLLFHSENSASNYDEIRHLCEKAANSGFPPGAYCMGHLYELGIGVSQDFPKAAKWFGEGASRGYGAAALRLGEMYLKGEGLNQDKLSAYEFIYMASNDGLLEAKQKKEGLEKDLTRKEIEKAKAKAAEWIRDHPPLALKGRGNREVIPKVLPTN